MTTPATTDSIAVSCTVQGAPDPALADRACPLFTAALAARWPDISITTGTPPPLSARHLAVTLSFDSPRVMTLTLDWTGSGDQPAMQRQLAVSDATLTAEILQRYFPRILQQFSLSTRP